MFDEPVLLDPVFAAPEVDPVLEFPVLAVPELGVPELLVVLADELPAVPGMFPHGEPFAVDPGVVLGLIVEGCVEVPVVGGLVDVEPGTGDGVVGEAVLPGGVAVDPDGVAVPGVFAPVVPGLPAGAVPPDGALCAATHTAQPRNTDNIVSFFADICEPPAEMC